jgi:hypothetical protein
MASERHRKRYRGRHVLKVGVDERRLNENLFTILE